MRRPFQPDEAQDLIHDHLLTCDNALLFVGMGVGKTAGCLWALRSLILDGAATAALVVAPNLVASLTWPDELRTWEEFKFMRFADLKTKQGRQDFLDGKAMVYLINYESLDKLKPLLAARGKVPPYDVVIWDELTRAKNPSSKRINRYRQFAPRPQRSWGLTGTPAPNSELDLFAQVRLVDGGERLGTSVTAFRDRWFTSVNHHVYTKWVPNPEVAGQIHERIADITLTLRTADWVDIPEPVLRDIPVNLTDLDMEGYTELKKTLFLELDTGGVITAANAAALVSKLLQFTSGVSYDEYRDTHEIHTAKIQALKKIAREAKSPVLVAIQFQHEQARIREAFPQARFFMDAKTQRAQNELKDAWNRGEVPLLVGHPASVGHGLNLQHGGHHIVWFTLTFSREQYEQMNCRLVRRGQKHSVRIDRLICPGTVDEVVAAVLENKASNEDKLLHALKILEEKRDGRWRHFQVQEKAGAGKMSGPLLPE